MGYGVGNIFGQSEFRSTATPRIWFSDPNPTPAIAFKKPNGSAVTPVAMINAGGDVWYYDMVEPYMVGEWIVGIQGTTSGVGIIQWGGTIDLLATAAENINDNINGNVGRIQQAVMGNTTWDHTTGTVGLFGGESFVLADEAGVPVSDQSLAVRRINSTV